MYTESVDRCVHDINVLWYSVFFFIIIILTITAILSARSDIVFILYCNALYSTCLRKSTKIIMVTVESTLRDDETVSFIKRPGYIQNACARFKGEQRIYYRDCHCTCGPAGLLFTAQWPRTTRKKWSYVHIFVVFFFLYRENYKRKKRKNNNLTSSSEFF